MHPTSLQPSPRSSNVIPANLETALARKLDIIRAATSHRDLRSPPGNMYEALNPPLKGYSSIRALRKPTTPGDVLQYEYLEPLNLKISDLAEMLNVHRNTISALVNNNRKLTADMAIKLAKAFDTTIEFWLNLQLNVDIWEAQSNSRTQEELSRIKTVADVMAKRKSGQPDVA
ncbi:hypothetical protein L1887_46661 [Cichorium endivia]|nr:hypothetical protein L1887_46661 [Cichorium endivia]